MNKIFTLALLFAGFSSFGQVKTPKKPTTIKAEKKVESGTPKKTVAPSVKQSNKKEPVERSIPGMPESFPKYIDTGNKQEDDKNYNIAKKKWIEENPELYKKLSSKNN